MKKLICLLLPVLMLLTACSTWQRSTPTTEYEQGLLMQEVDLEPSITVNPVLYFLNEAGTKLEAETREINVPQNEMREKYVVQALIDGPQTASLTPVAEGYQLNRIELLSDVVNVYLDKEGTRRESDVINLKFALSATLSDYTGKTYVNIFINGTQFGYQNMPTGAFQKSNEDLAEQLNLLQQKTQAKNPTMQAVLYFLDASETFLLPEARRLAFSGNEDYITVLVEELIKGPVDAYNHQPVVESTLKLLGYEIEETTNGNDIVKLNFNMEPFLGSQKFIDSNKLAVAALTYTICSFMPNTTGIEILVNGRAGGDVIHSMSDYEELLGSNILLYLQSSTTPSILMGVDRIIEQDKAYVPRVVLGELMRGPSGADTDSRVESTIPMGISLENVKEVYIANDTVVVDFDKTVDEVMQSVSEDMEFIMLFSIVNTLTSIEGIRRVQFLVEGERVEYLGDGKISIIDPVIKNPGIIRYS
ncbi:GerMN domain-containing protein [Christensenellaceae bacterium OttesenSCG-928-K19]|nr:GerMN domain-containing protein [Christensenellaceae bacterium OttesenSCG-928-K19]